MKYTRFITSSCLVILSLFGLTLISSLNANRNLANAQDVLTSTPTRLAPSGVVWRGRLSKVVPQANLDGGAILHVYVQGREGEFVEVQQINTILKNTTGTKAELGSYGAEFAPLSEGRWLISLPALGVSTAIQTDDDSLFEVTFEQISAAQATAELRPEATATPLNNISWVGEQIGQLAGPSIAGALLKVKIVGQSGVPVNLQTKTDFIGQGITGNKLENPADEVEFAGLSEGQYIIVPQGLNIEYVVNLKVNTTTFIEFKPAPAPTPTFTATRPKPTSTPRPTEPPTVTLPPTSPPSRWQVRVQQRQETEQIAAQLMIEVDGNRNQAISVSGGDPFRELICSTKRKVADRRYACDIPNLLPGVYTVTLTDYDFSTPLRVDTKEMVTLHFFNQALIAEDKIDNDLWQVSVTLNTNRSRPTGLAQSRLNVRLQQQPGQIVSLVNSLGQRRLCETETSGTCQFEFLGAGVYRLETANIPVRYALYLDGVGQAVVNFEQVSVIAQAAIIDINPTAAPISGRGAVPRPAATATATTLPTQAPTSTATITPTETPIPTSTRRLFRYTTTATTPPTTAIPTRQPTVRPTATPTVTATPTAAPVWLGEVIENYQHPGQTLVVQAALGDHPVVLRSGPWQLEGRTDSKPEYGSGAVEFSGLTPGQYEIELVGLSEATVDVGVDRFVRVLFSYGPAPEPTATAEPGQWTAAIIKNTSGSEPGGGAWSILTVQVGSINNLSVRIFTDGFETDCITGTKPELGPGICQIGGLWPATYQVQPVGLPITLDVPLDGRGAADVAFWQQ